jgi:hypothetical protein
MPDPLAVVHGRIDRRARLGERRMAMCHSRNGWPSHRLGVRTDLDAMTVRASVSRRVR